MIVTRKTYWSNGLETEREIEVDSNEKEEFVKVQERRIALGPGIEFVILTSTPDLFVRFLFKGK